MDNISIEEYNNIPVHYCRSCLSLRVKTVASVNLDYCDEFSSTDIEETHIEEWRKLYKERYGFDYLEK